MPARKRIRGRTTRATACAEYSFRQRFRVPASWAFTWCVDYRPDDWSRQNLAGTRDVTWLGPHTVLLDDARAGPNGRLLHKLRMVQVYPRYRRWINTHVKGPRLHSQFTYTITPEGANASVLLFEGRELRWKGRPRTAQANARLARALRDEDARLWKGLAAWMERDYRSR